MKTENLWIGAILTVTVAAMIAVLVSVAVPLRLLEASNDD